MARRSTTPRKPTAAEDRAFEQGRRDALSGLPKSHIDVAHGSDNIFSALAGLSARSAWLWGWKQGDRDMEEMADEAVRAVAGSNPAVAAAMRYVEVCHDTQILRDPERRAKAAAELLAALLDRTDEDLRAALADSSAGLTADLGDFKQYTDESGHVHGGLLQVPARLGEQLDGRQRVVTFTAACPARGADATWRQEATDSRPVPVTTVRCPACDVVDGAGRVSAESPSGAQASDPLLTAAGPGEPDPARPPVVDAQDGDGGVAGETDRVRRGAGTHPGQGTGVVGRSADPAHSTEECVASAIR
jgi:hypothetical protein